MAIGGFSIRLFWHEAVFMRSERSSEAATDVRSFLSDVVMLGATSYAKASFSITIFNGGKRRARRASDRNSRSPTQGSARKHLSPWRPAGFLSTDGSLRRYGLVQSSAPLQLTVPTG